jgi:hypothetical protein
VRFKSKLFNFMIPWIARRILLSGAGFCHGGRVIFFSFPLKTLLVRLEYRYPFLDVSTFHIKAFFRGELFHKGLLGRK